ncbi:MAG: hypothetical protein AAF360_05245 [Pseudomonadota bacterium]
MVGRGDPVARELPVGLKQRRIEREEDLGARHHLPLERVPMHINEGGGERQPTRVNLMIRRCCRPDRHDLSGGDGYIGFNHLIPQDDAPAFESDAHVLPQSHSARVA